MHAQKLVVLLRYDIPAIDYISSAVGRLFKSGLGRFGLGQVCWSIVFVLAVSSLFKLCTHNYFACSRNQVLGEGLAALSRFETDSYSRKNFLYKLILADLTRYDIPGLEYILSAVGPLLKSGLGKFGVGQVCWSIVFLIDVSSLFKLWTHSYFACSLNTSLATKVFSTFLLWEV